MGFNIYLCIPCACLGTSNKCSSVEYKCSRKKIQNGVRELPQIPLFIPEISKLLPHHAESNLVFLTPSVDSWPSHICPEAHLFQPNGKRENIFKGWGIYFLRCQQLLQIFVNYNSILALSITLIRTLCGKDCQQIGKLSHKSPITFQGYCVHISHTSHPYISLAALLSPLSWASPLSEITQQSVEMAIVLSA